MFLLGLLPSLIYCDARLKETHTEEIHSCLGDGNGATVEGQHGNTSLLHTLYVVFACCQWLVARAVCCAEESCCQGGCHHQLWFRETRDDSTGEHASRLPHHHVHSDTVSELHLFSVARVYDRWVLKIPCCLKTQKTKKKEEGKKIFDFRQKLLWRHFYAKKL